MRHFIAITNLWLVIGLCSAHAGDRPALDTAAARASYAIGYQAMEELQGHGAEPDLPALLRGMLDAISGSAPLLSEAEMQAALTPPVPEAATGIKQELPQIRQDRAFLAANAKKAGVTTLPSGLQYRIIQAGTGVKPGRDDSVTVHYRGTLVDGREFDSSYREDRPATYRMNEVMPGWTEALQRMPEGAIWELVIPPRLAFGKRGPLENRTLIYRLELLAVIPSKAHPPQAGTPSGSE